MVSLERLIEVMTGYADEATTRAVRRMLDDPESEASRLLESLPTVASNPLGWPGRALVEIARVAK